MEKANSDKPTGRPYPQSPMPMGREGAAESPLAEEPSVSFIIPAPPDMETPAALDSLEALDYPREKFEIIVARGRRPARQRNEAAREARGEVLFFLDDDSIVAPDILRTNLAHYSDPQVAGVGGPALPLEAKNTVQAATDVVFASIFGDFRGCMRFARRGPARPVSEDEVILCNLSVRRDVFEEAGGFHDALYPNEENALLEKVLRMGKGRVFIYEPSAPIERARPGTVGEFFRKVFGYGTGRLEQTLIQPSPICLMRLASVFFPLYWILLPFLLLVTPWAAVPGGLYFAGNAAMSVKIAATVRSLKVAGAAFLLFPVMHVAYPIGILWAATVRRIFGRRADDAKVEVAKVKELGRA